MENISTEYYMEKIQFFMEEKRMYLIEGINIRDVSSLLGVGKRRLGKILFYSLGIDMKEMVSMYRVQYARELLILGVEYRKLWRLAGFSSQYGMNRALENIAV